MSNGRAFASDSCSPVHPAVLAAIERVNVGHTNAYGDDPHTADAVARIKAAFGASAEPYFVFNGTSANVMALESCLEPFETVICAEWSHIYVDECGAVERMTGSRVTPVPSPDGKVTVDAMMARVVERGVVHKVQPRAVSITQSTEYGTVYRPAEVRALADAAHAAGLYLHMDGARLANAAAALGVSLAETTGDAGVDVLSFGGTKNGALGAEAVVFFNPELARSFEFRRKQRGQLASKMRYPAAQFAALLTDDLWRRNAEHANAMTRRLAAGLEGMPGFMLTQPVEANAIFALVPPGTVAALQRGGEFYVWDEGRTEIRLMCAFDTTPGDVDLFLDNARRVLAT